MRNNRVLLLLAVVAFGISSNGLAEHVKGYTRKDGTYVHGYERGSTRAPTQNSSKPKAHAPAASSTPPTVHRDADGHIERSSSARDAFQKSHPCPSTRKTSGACPGYVVDHVIALKRGGADAPSNMQWQTVEAAKAKDRVE